MCYIWAANSCQRQNLAIRISFVQELIIPASWYATLHHQRYDLHLKGFEKDLWEQEVAWTAPTQLPLMLPIPVPEKLWLLHYLLHALHLLPVLLPHLRGTYWEIIRVWVRETCVVLTSVQQWFEV